MIKNGERRESVRAGASATFAAHRRLLFPRNRRFSQAYRLTGTEKISSIRFITPSISSPNFVHLLLRTKVPSFPAVTRQSSLSILPRPGQVGQRLFPRPHVALVAHVHGPLLPGHVPVSSFEKQNPSTRDVALGQKYLPLPPNSRSGTCTFVSCFFQRVSRLPCITRGQ